MRLMHPSLQRTRWWFLYDTIVAWLLVGIAAFLLLVRPLPSEWQNVTMGILAAWQFSLWLWTLNHKHEPDKAHSMFLRMTALVFIAMIGVSSRHHW